MNPYLKLLSKIPRKDRIAIQDTIAMIVLRIFENLDIKKLKGHKDLFRVRVGRYRVVYFDDGKDVMVRFIAIRNESTYRDL